MQLLSFLKRHIISLASGMANFLLLMYSGTMLNLLQKKDSGKHLMLTINCLIVANSWFYGRKLRMDGKGLGIPLAATVINRLKTIFKNLSRSKHSIVIRFNH